MKAQPAQEGPRVNKEIRAPQVRLVDENGEMVGVVSIEDALKRASRVGIDLIEVSPNAEPPVCKILDSGKYKYEAQKRKAEAKKKQKVVQVKEIKMRPGIDQHDYEVKMRNVFKFLDNGDKVKVTLRYRGREMAHQELGLEILNRVKADTVEVAKVEHHPKMEGRQMIMILGPIPTGAK
ncbi:protein chain initiation factor IF-3 [Candidatus Terasakiella magnetica]|uniref:Translation initiation factor IF-3 n=1 Tax=Candidatus Terasakiella magnetica TaxID=1867952 RepID=A0A1C3RII9_9PROT|nr:translation initiation factor IF-3 [Candidatus Terasakiella magnetica]SCA57079.1 protein chain initiation factor IF-3 [Candidatus Terasakiella magnetica]